MMHAFNVCNMTVDWGMVGHSCNPIAWETEIRELELEVSLDYVARSCLQTKLNRKLPIRFVQRLTL